MSASKTEFRLLMSPLTRTIYAGRVKDLGGGGALSTGVRHDVTNDFLGVVIQYGEIHGGAFEIVGGGDMYDVTVTKRAAQAKQGGAARAKDVRDMRALEKARRIRNGTQHRCLQV